jgi:hypothetical protein
MGVVALTAFVGVAFADAVTTWDGTYAREGAGGNELCPDVDSVTVTKGSFSMPWTIRYANARKFRVGTIDGTISASGTVKVNAAVFAPLAAETLKMVEEMGDSLDDLKKVSTEMKIRVQAKGKRRISLSSGMCYASWDGGDAPTVDEDEAAALRPPAPTAKVTKKGKPAAKPKKTTKAAPAKAKPAVIAKPAPAKPPAAKPTASSTPKASPPQPAESKPAESKPAPKPKLELRPGDKCEEDEDCESNTCTFGQCYGRHGKPEFVSGSRCMHDADCASGTCHDTCR